LVWDLLGGRGSSFAPLGILELLVPLKVHLGNGFSSFGGLLATVYHYGTANSGECDHNVGQSDAHFVATALHDILTEKWHNTNHKPVAFPHSPLSLHSPNKIGNFGSCLVFTGPDQHFALQVVGLVVFDRLPHYLAGSKGPPHHGTN